MYFEGLWQIQVVIRLQQTMLIILSRERQR